MIFFVNPDVQREERKTSFCRRERRRVGAVAKYTPSIARLTYSMIVGIKPTVQKRREIKELVDQYRHIKADALL